MPSTTCPPSLLEGRSSRQVGGPQVVHDLAGSSPPLSNFRPRQSASAFVHHARGNAVRGCRGVLLARRGTVSASRDLNDGLFSLEELRAPRWPPRPDWAIRTRPTAAAARVGTPRSRGHEAQSAHSPETASERRLPRPWRTEGKHLPLTSSSWQFSVFWGIGPLS